MAVERTRSRARNLANQIDHTLRHIVAVVSVLVVGSGVTRSFFASFAFCLG
jgi:hypothetical protein